MVEVYVMPCGEGISRFRDISWTSTQATEISFLVPTGLDLCAYWHNIVECTPQSAFRVGQSCD